MKQSNEDKIEKALRFVVMILRVLFKMMYGLFKVFRMIYSRLSRKLYGVLNPVLDRWYSLIYVRACVMFGCESELK